MSIERFGSPAPGAPPYSKAVRAGDFVFLSGQVPMGADGTVVAGGIEAQTKQSIENIKAILASLGLELKDVVKATAWLADTRDFAAFNRVYAQYFGAALPARSCVRSDMVIDCKVEIEAIAYAPKG
jgi:2-iminobutanoate/2-iminopropanoate deaminase